MPDVAETLALLDRMRAGHAEVATLDADLTTIAAVLSRGPTLLSTAREVAGKINATRTESAAVATRTADALARTKAAEARKRQLAALKAGARR